MEKVYFLTPTGGRPEGLALLAEYLDAQTYDGPGMWVVVDDVDPQSHVPATRFPTQVIRPSWRWNPGDNTQARCMLAALRTIPRDAVVFILEDDDCYLPGYVEAALKALSDADLVGEDTARYYNVATGRYRHMHTDRHSSLASTAVRGTGALIAACERGPKFIDLTLWRTFRGPKALRDTQHVIGIKGLPGRAGIGVGHRRKFGTPDTRSILEQWAGDYARNYEVFRQ